MVLASLVIRTTNHHHDGCQKLHYYSSCHIPDRNNTDHEKYNSLVMITMSILSNIATIIIIVLTSLIAFMIVIQIFKTRISTRTSAVE